MPVSFCTAEVAGSNALGSTLMKIYTSTVVQVAEVVERELDRSRAARPYPYSHIERKGTGDA
jgi:hypothetical protein